MQAIHGLHLAGMLRMSKSAVLPICRVSAVHREWRNHRDWEKRQHHILAVRQNAPRTAMVQVVSRPAKAPQPEQVRMRRRPSRATTVGTPNGNPPLRNGRGYSSTGRRFPRSIATARIPAGKTTGRRPAIRVFVAAGCEYRRMTERCGLRRC